MSRTYQTVKSLMTYDDHFDTIPDCDRQTDRQTDGQIPVLILRISMLNFFLEKKIVFPHLDIFVQVWKDIICLKTFTEYMQGT